MSGALGTSSRRISTAGLFAAIAVAVLLCAGSARAATYGSSSFTGSAEGWAVKSAGCTIPITCSASGGYDGTSGNPPGSLAADSTILLNLVGLFKTTVVSESPDFEVGEGGNGTLRLQRQFAPGALLALAPNATYVASLVDKTAGTESKAIGETISGESGFAVKEGPAALVAGHTYAIRIATEVDSTLVGLSLGTASVRFDNVSLTGPGANPGGGSGGNRGDGGPGSGGGGGAGGKGSDGRASLTRLQLFRAIRSSAVRSAVVKRGGKFLVVRVKCPRSIGSACRLTVRGMVNRAKPATNRRRVKVGKGRTRRVVLRVKPSLRSRVGGKRKRLLVRQRVRAGKQQATVYKQVWLVGRR